jgi:hypothetical protein
MVQEGKLKADRRLNIKKASFFAWVWFGIIVIAALATFPDTSGSDNVQASVLKAMIEVLDSLTILAFPLVGALIVSRQPQNTIGWLLMVPTLTIPLDLFTRSQILGVTIPPSHPSIFFWMAAYLSNTTWLFAIFPVFFIALLFPTGRPLSARWRWVAAYATGIFVFFFCVAVFAKTLAPDASLYGVDWSIPNPLGFLDAGTSETAFEVWLAGVIVLALLCVASIILRYRRAAGVERKQINWLLYAIGLFGVFYIPYTLFQAWRQFLGLFVDLFLMAIPLAIGMAILRYRLYEIDMIIRRTLQYAILTGLLALVYFGVVILLQNVFDSVSGQQSPLVIVISTLLIAALFAPLRQRVQSFIDRRFYRQKYDAQQILAQFAQTARDEVGMDVLQAELLRVVQETLRPEQISVWLKPLTHNS